jgi:uncharacterized protein Yka (UPF0111/DUF47 family)
VPPRLSGVLVPNDRVYFELFEEAGRNLLRSAELLDTLLSDYPDSSQLAAEIKSCEHEGDRITHEIIDRLNHTFVTPIDREDILALASALYRIEAPMEQSLRQAGVLRAAAREIANAIPQLRGFRDISRHTVEVNRLENEGDQITRAAMASLFDTGIDPMVVIRWKDLFERLEAAIDATERVANIMEGIIIKNS